VDVLIVGAGPSGLVLADVLARYGVPVRIVDRKPGPVPQSRAAIVHVRTLELLDRLGLRERAMARGVPVPEVRLHQRGRPAGGFPLPAGGATPPVLTQDQTERLLVDGLAELGGRVEWNTELVALDGPAGYTARPRASRSPAGTTNLRC
jgi:2-polyprenyl-6-methoxyphenol hydroxylase-like FAD-dependent oxidoreductase